jgi:hypothetical protein
MQALMQFLRRLAQLLGFGAESLDPLSYLAQKVEPQARADQPCEKVSERRSVIPRSPTPGFP